MAILCHLGKILCHFVEPKFPIPCTKKNKLSTNQLGPAAQSMCASGSLQKRTQTIMQSLCAIQSNMTVAQRFTQAIVKARSHGCSVEALDEKRAQGRHVHVRIWL